MSSIHEALKRAKLERKDMEQDGGFIHCIHPSIKRKGIFRRFMFFPIVIVFLGGIMGGLVFRKGIEGFFHTESSEGFTVKIPPTPAEQEGLSKKGGNEEVDINLQEGRKEGDLGSTEGVLEKPKESQIPISDGKGVILGKDAYKKALELAKKGDVDGAISHYILATSGPEPVKEGLLKIGDLYLEKKGDPDRASIFYLKAIKSDPKNPKAHNNLGVCYLRKGNITGAKKEFLKAIELKEDFAVAYYNMACVKAIERDYADALSWLKKAISYSPQCLEWAMEDPDLDNLRDQEGFKELKEFKMSKIPE